MLKAETGDVHFSRVLSSSDLLESDLLEVLGVLEDSPDLLVFADVLSSSDLSESALLEVFPDLLDLPDLPDLPDFDLLNLTDFRDFLERWYLLDLPCL